MTKDDRDRAETGFNKPAKYADAESGKKDREASAKAVLDNMARLKALRLAKEAAEPAATAKMPRGRSAKKSSGKTAALGDWLSSQQSGGHRT